MLSQEDFIVVQTLVNRGVLQKDIVEQLRVHQRRESTRGGLDNGWGETYSVHMDCTESPVLEVDLTSSRPLVHQIVDGLRVALVRGDLPPGAFLPPVRRLAQDLGVHFNTVAEAYRRLAAEGWLEMESRRKARVTSRTAPQPDAQAEAAFRRDSAQLMAAYRARGLAPERMLAWWQAMADSKGRVPGEER